MADDTDAQRLLDEYVEKGYEVEIGADEECFEVTRWHSDACDRRVTKIRVSVTVRERWGDCAGRVVAVGTGSTFDEAMLAASGVLRGE